MPSDILTIALSAFTPDARPPAVRPVSPADEPELAVLYLRSYPPDIGAQNLDKARAEIKATFDGEFGYARKTRSPNFYERYAWSTSGMAASMISWFGDANGYVGEGSPDRADALVWALTELMLGNTATYSLSAMA